MDKVGTLLDIKKWFPFLCKVAAECLRDDSSFLSKDQIDFLVKKSAYRMENTFLSMFLTLDLRYEFKNKIQRDFMASLYIRDLGYEQQKEFFKDAPYRMLNL